jgi:hypothetical protein
MHYFGCILLISFTCRLWTVYNFNYTQTTLGYKIEEKLYLRVREQERLIPVHYTTATSLRKRILNETRYTCIGFYFNPIQCFLYLRADLNSPWPVTVSARAQKTAI